MILHYNGDTWVQMESPTPYDLYGVWGSSPRDVFAVGQAGVILHYNGSVWSVMCFWECDLHGVWGSAYNDLWSQMTSNTGFTLNGVWGSSHSRVFAVGGTHTQPLEGFVDVYDGTTWNVVWPTFGEFEYPPVLYGVWGWPSVAPTPAPTPTPTPTPTPAPSLCSFFDSFENGNLNNWVQDTQNDWSVTSTRHSDGVYSAQVNGATADATLTLRNALNLSGHSSGTLTFSWFIDTAFNVGEYVACDVWNGVGWTEVARIKGNVDPENSWQNKTVSLGASYMRSDFKVRFRARINTVAAVRANVDAVRVCATP
jgi:hypothetical protein